MLLYARWKTELSSRTDPYELFEWSDLYEAQQSNFLKSTTFLHSHISSTIFGPVSRNKTCKKKNIFLYNFVNQNNVILEEHSRKKSRLLDCISQLKKKCRLAFFFPQLKKKNPFFLSPEKKNTWFRPGSNWRPSAIFMKACKADVMTTTLRNPAEQSGWILIIRIIKTPW